MVLEFWYEIKVNRIIILLSFICLIYLFRCYIWLTITIRNTMIAVLHNDSRLSHLSQYATISNTPELVYW